MTLGRRNVGQQIQNCSGIADEKWQSKCAFGFGISLQIRLEKNKNQKTKFFSDIFGSNLKIN